MNKQHTVTNHTSIYLMLKTPSPKILPNTYENFFVVVKWNHVLGRRLLRYKSIIKFSPNNKTKNKKNKQKKKKISSFYSFFFVYSHFPHLSIIIVCVCKTICLCECMYVWSARLYVSFYFVSFIQHHLF